MHNVSNRHELGIERALGLLHLRLLGSQPLLNLFRALNQSRRVLLFSLELADFLAGFVELLPDFVELELPLAPLVVEGDDLVDELDGGGAVALRPADQLRVAALLRAEEVDVEHLRRRAAAAAAASREGRVDEEGFAACAAF
jgi:hypothetical protein